MLKLIIILILVVVVAETNADNNCSKCVIWIELTMKMKHMHERLQAKSHSRTPIQPLILIATIRKMDFLSKLQLHTHALASKYSELTMLCAIIINRTCPRHCQLNQVDESVYILFFFRNYVFVELPLTVYKRLYTRESTEIVWVFVQTRHIIL